MPEAKRTDPELWDKVKDEITRSGKGGTPGQWSARKAQMAVQAYKSRGGGYADEGPERDETDLHQWTEEDWGTKSGARSATTGERYLPREVRMLLTEDEYRRSTEKKTSDSHDGSEQVSDQPDDVAEKANHIRRHDPTKAMVDDRARDLGIEGRSSMSKEDLLAAIDEATDENGRGYQCEAGLRALTKDQLLRRARDAGVEGRSRMSKDDLIEALRR